jgi:hypothetical protein
MHLSTWHLEKAEGIHDWLHVCRSLRHCISWIGKRGGIDGVRRFGAHVPKLLVRHSLAFGNAQVARRPQNLKLTCRSSAMQRRRSDNTERQIRDGKKIRENSN